MDVGIGDTFNARVAGNIANEDIFGSMEFACKLAGAKVILVMGHTACGAIKGAIDNVQLGNLTALLAKIRPAVTQLSTRANVQRAITASWMRWREECRAHDAGHPSTQFGPGRSRKLGCNQDRWIHLQPGNRSS